MMDATNPAYPPLRDAELIAALDERVRALEAEYALLLRVARAAQPIVDALEAIPVPELDADELELIAALHRLTPVVH